MSPIPMPGVTSTMSLDNMLCARCGDGFEPHEKIVNSTGQLWHQQCFVCAQCFQEFDDGIFYEYDDRKYCERDFQILFAPCCGKCNNFIIGRVIKAMNASWHPECFRCEMCETELADTGFIKNAGRALCHECNAKVKAIGSGKHVCHKCHALIDDKPLKFRGEMYHPYHFNCTNCGVELDYTAREVRSRPGFAANDMNELYCLRCHDKMGIPICGACRRPIEERVVTALGKHWHVEHFVCAKCEKPFFGHRHYEKKGLAYCETHYHQLFGNLCFVCNQVIAGDVFTALNKAWCVHHFACSVCDQKMNQKTKFYECDLKPVFENDGMPQLICKTCRAQALQSYTFKTNCKKADDALKVFLATGSLTRPWSQEELNEQTKTFQATKRVVDQAEENRNKKIKRENSDVITLNYSASLSHDSNTEESNFNEESVEGPSFASTESEEQNDQSMENDDFMNLEEESVLNPVLKVNQVKTDCFPCPHCERSFPLKQLLDLHQSNHDRERNYNCNSCEKAFFTKYDLSKHLLIHTGSKPFTCVVCEKTFARESLLHRHEKIHVNVPKYLCSQCDRTFLTGEDLDAHTAKHKKKRPFMCKICSKSFVFKQGLERHEQTHNNVKPHKCNYCEASFTSAIKLTRHVTSHAGLRPYPCKMCGRTFLLSHHLTRHMRSHYAAQQSEACVPSIGQYKCDVCSMSFRRKDSLINHSAIHSMVNLKCVICNTEFDNVVKVKEHITTHLSDLPFPCEKCDYSFETQEQLEDHELKHAEMEYEEQIEQEVLAEARQAAAVKDSNDEENSDYSGDDIAEFTITNDMENPEVVRRSKRASKIKNYAEFLKDELGSEIEDNAEGQEELPEGENTGDEAPNPEETHEEAIKPIVRSEGTKVYSRKSLPERPKVAPQLSLDQGNVAPLSKITQPHTINSLEHLSKDLSKIPDKEVFNMKIGDKTVTVQKLLLTKEQMKAMAKEGKIEKKGNTLLLKKTASQSFQSVSLDSIFGKSELKTPKKTYQRKVSSGGDDTGEGTITLNEHLNLPMEENSS